MKGAILFTQFLSCSDRLSVTSGFIIDLMSCNGIFVDLGVVSSSLHEALWWAGGQLLVSAVCEAVDGVGCPDYDNLHNTFLRYYIRSHDSGKSDT